MKEKDEKLPAETLQVTSYRTATECRGSMPCSARVWADGARSRNHLWPCWGGSHLEVWYLLTQGSMSGLKEGVLAGLILLPPSTAAHTVTLMWLCVWRGVAHLINP